MQHDGSSEHGCGADRYHSGRMSIKPDLPIKADPAAEAQGLEVLGILSDT